MSLGLFLSLFLVINTNYHHHHHPQHSFPRRWWSTLHATEELLGINRLLISAVEHIFLRFITVYRLLAFRMDRFVPIRGPLPIGDRFRTIKHPRELSSSERLSRTDSFAPDAFISNTRRMALLTTSSRRASRSDGVDRRAGAWQRATCL